MLVKIKEPIWKNRSVGVAKDKITEDLEIEILYKDKFGNRVFPNPYSITKSEVLKYPTMTIKNKILHIIPIEDMRENEGFNYKY